MDCSQRRKEWANRPTKDEIAVGVKVFTRTDRLDSLIASIPADLVSTVYVADDGPEEQKEERYERIYDREYPFSLEVLDLEYDVGVGYGRNEIVEALSEDYLLMLDSDYRLPINVSVLYEVLEKRPDLGAVSGATVEPENDNVQLMGCDFVESDGVLTLSPFHSEKSVEMVSEYPIVRFDFIATAGLYRRECLDDYSWDPEMVLGGEHFDFYVGHWKTTNWSFAVCPQVLFQHYPGGNDEYTTHRFGDQKLRSDENRFLRKWGYDDLAVESYMWYLGGETVTPNSVFHRAKRLYDDEGASVLAKRVFERLT